MKKDNIEEEELVEMLKQLEVERFPIESSKKLIEMLQRSQSSKVKGQSTFERYLGRFTLIVLVGLNLLLFIYLNPFNSDLVGSLGLIAFLIGIGVILLFLKKLKIVTAF